MKHRNNKGKMRALLHSARLRTLPLSLAGVACGILLGRNAMVCNGYTAIALSITIILTTAALQILSNFSNELGDFQHGTDRNDRQGPQYSLGSGTLTANDLKKAIAASAIGAALFGTTMIYLSCHTLFSLTALTLFTLGATAIWAAMHYTLGKKPYGYHGWGDLFVFIFFGIVAVAGAYFVATHTLPFSLFLPASAIGLCSIGVLNVNNMRDIESDKATRTTIPILLGLRRAKIYHSFLIIATWLLLPLYTFLSTSQSLATWLYTLCLPLYIVHLILVWQRKDKALDSMLPMLVLSTFTLSIIFGIVSLL